ncbi:MAG: cob(I)yrinic acid a,c-diamide adenosyltransferase, partial [Candidatus Atribacteria bacterium]|nr:cob(I)yrinic acid a,c-diamide adenosyltransferase [Candidatus Atribacteria bacterium]
QVYYGEGKGKTTASLGLILRAVGHNWRVLLIQFFKNAFTGEIASLQCLPGVTVYRFGSREFVWEGEISEDTKQEFLCGWHLAQEALRSREYDLIVLDELPYAFFYDLLSWEEFQKTMQTRNPQIEIVITGRRVPEALIDFADLVSEIRAVKHPYHQGVPARKGVEY